MNAFAWKAPNRASNDATWCCLAACHKIESTRLSISQRGPFFVPARQGTEWTPLFSISKASGVSEIGGVLWPSYPICT